MQNPILLQTMQDNQDSSINNSSSPSTNNNTINNNTGVPTNKDNKGFAPSRRQRRHGEFDQDIVQFTINSTQQILTNTSHTQHDAHGEPHEGAHELKEIQLKPDDKLDDDIDDSLDGDIEESIPDDDQDDQEVDLTDDTNPSLTKQQLIIQQQLEDQLQSTIMKPIKERNYVTFGLVGHPNVGKSTLVISGPFF